ncbi:alpha/beta fold hydrolase [Photobacterium kishitanii]|uniref:Alpha/beta hydrolase n=1 Tax=Photobacterium kishitanii TaxID=318456 RepID=A0AAX0Z0Y2_9GAMM|nr:alpha/beta fold hydrolase [Photobacterium kishitanii]OBU29664.1 hypothetical protein AYY23_07955 [Photobacterium kishitanii]PSU15857.1 alpha/beta hydrolase [Photobacterium kishitanii]PSW49458.1 alpha/beta hydrolase [Photobacterium kishitanii]PSW62770.1 alpha/beta hydrolase [Photobacterium kishitanii]PSX19988.1 alpha/beta hydrolase [Photobacterium kishitanii]
MLQVKISFTNQDSKNNENNGEFIYIYENSASENNYMKLRITFYLLLLQAFYQNPVYASSTLSTNHAKNENIIVIHGFGQNAKGMEFITNGLKNTGYNTCVLEYKTVGRSVDTIKKQVVKQINDCFLTFDNSYNTHFIGHSLGGLMIRSYLADHPSMLNKRKIDKVIMMGTPNNGSPISDSYREKSIFGLLGEMSLALGTDEGDLAKSLPEPFYKTGIIAGNKPWRITRKAFNEPNDGLVPVSSTKLPNMGDFIELNVDHASMRTNQLVIGHILEYLDKGKFV